MNNYNWTPKQWAEFNIYEKAIVIAGIDLRLEKEEKERKKAERESDKAKRARGRR
jgi:hypothetical protein